MSALAPAFRLPPSAIWLLAALAGYWALLIYQLGAQWSAYEQYNYGWAVPFLCAYLLWQRLRNAEGGGRRAAQCKIKNAKGKMGSTAGRRRAEDGGQGSDFGLQTSASVTRHSGSVTYLLIALLAVLWFVARWLHEANPIWRLTSWAMAFAVLGLTLLVLHQMAEDGGRVSAFQRFSISPFIFPLGFFLVAVPWPTVIEAPVVQFLTRANAAVTIEILNTLGIPALQRGSVIEISTGLVGIDDACSGIRSLQATLMISLFLGELYRLSVFRRVAFCLAGFALAFLFNIGRTFLLVYVASRDGIAAIDKWHDPAGITILVGCFLGLWLLGLWLARGQRTESRRPRTEDGNPKVGDPQPSTLGPRLLTSPGLRRLSLALVAWLILTEVAVEGWYRYHEARASAAQAWTLRWPTEDQSFKRVDLSESVTAQLSFDEGGQGDWTDPDGSFWQVFYFRWQPSRSLYARVRSQLNKTHRPEHCLIGAGMKQVGDLGVGQYRCGGVGFALNRLLFESDGRLLRVFYAQYEDSAKPELLANYRENTKQRIASAWAGSRNYGLRILELAVAGHLDEPQADAAVQRQLERLIQVPPAPRP